MVLDKNSLMKVSIYIKQSLLQIVTYFILYQIILILTKDLHIARFDLNTGISSYYMFYSFIFFSVLFNVILFLTKKKTALILSIELFISILLSIYLYNFTNIIIYLIWIVLFLSVYGPYFIL